jgi:hypothetical protein
MGITLAVSRATNDEVFNILKPYAHIFIPPQWVVKEVKMISYLK